jgi:hypothetical protein
MEDSIDYQSLLHSNGYTKSVCNHYKTYKSTDTLYQKCIKDKVGKKYYINIWWYPVNRYGETLLPESIQAEVQFTGYEGDGTTDVLLFTKDLVKIEAKFEDIWNLLKFDYYERWEDQ